MEFPSILTGSDAAYANTLRWHCQVPSPENALTWAALRPDEYSFDWAEADTLVGFALAAGNQGRGYTLVWPQSIPARVSNSAFSTSQIPAIARSWSLCSPQRGLPYQGISGPQRLCATANLRVRVFRVERDGVSGMCGEQCSLSDDQMPNQKQSYSRTAAPAFPVHMPRKPNPRQEYRLKQRERIDASPVLAQRFPRLKALRVTLEFFDAAGLTRQGEMKCKLNVAHAKSALWFACPGVECTCGDFDLSQALAQAVAGRHKVATGELRCEGTRKRGAGREPTACGTRLRYKLNLNYD